MDKHDGSFDGKGGVRIAWQAWRAEGPGRSVVVLCHGVSEHAGRYGHVVERLLPEGHHVYGLDHRGHGRSEGPRAYIDSLDSAVADVDTLVDQARTDEPDLPLYLLGHSLGGCIAIEYALAHQDRLDGLILSAPLAAVEAASPAVRGVSRVLSRLTPRLGILEVDSAGISRDADEVRAYEQDPLVYRGKLPVRTVAVMAAAIETFSERVPTLTLPLLVMHGSEDRLTAPGGSRMVDARASSEDKTLHIYEGYYHEIFNEPPAERERVLDDLAGWLDEHSEAGRRSPQAVR